MNKLRILVIEDDVVTGKIIQRMLKIMGHEVISVVANGNDAIHVAKFQKPDLILSDYLIPGEMNGMETAREIRKFYQAPIIFLTGHINDVKDSNPVASSVFLNKECLDYNELKDTIERSLHSPD